MSGIGWRVLAILAFLPLALLWVVPQLVQEIAAALAGLLFGPDEERTDRITEGPPAVWLARSIDYLMNKAGFRS